jgi:hypothetical protein
MVSKRSDPGPHDPASPRAGVDRPEAAAEGGDREAPLTGDPQSHTPGSLPPQPEPIAEQERRQRRAAERRSSWSGRRTDLAHEGDDPPMDAETALAAM